MKPDDFCLLGQKRTKTQLLRLAAVINNHRCHTTVAFKPRGGSEQRERPRWDDFLLDSACGKQGAGESSIRVFRDNGTSDVPAAAASFVRHRHAGCSPLPIIPRSPPWLHGQTLASLPVAYWAPRQRAATLLASTPPVLDAHHQHKWAVDTVIIHMLAGRTRAGTIPSMVPVENMPSVVCFCSSVY